MATTTTTFSFLLSCVLTLIISSTPATAQIATSPSLSPSLAPAPAPAPPFVNLANLLSVAGPFSTFLNYLTQTKLMETFQNQANNTDQGITIFVPTDSAFSSLKKPSLSNLTQQQLKSFLLFHALPKYYTLAQFTDLSNASPVSSFAGGQFTLNFTDKTGVIRVDSSWSNPKISSSVYSTRPVAVYEVQHVLLPVAIFGTAPPRALAPAPAPDTTKPSDLAPSDSSSVGSPKSAESSTSSSVSYTKFCFSFVNLLGLAVSAGWLMLLF